MTQSDHFMLKVTLICDVSKLEVKSPRLQSTFSLSQDSNSKKDLNLRRETQTLLANYSLKLKFL